MQHARSIALVLSLSTGNVSPQYHCYMDNTFDTVVGAEARFIPKSQWQAKTKFKGEVVEERKPIATISTPTIVPEVAPQHRIQQNEGEGEIPQFLNENKQIQLEEYAPIVREEAQPEIQQEEQPLPNVRRSG
jgi:hypothetical protein